jgi:hypothetical protein
MYQSTGAQKARHASNGQLRVERTYLLSANNRDLEIRGGAMKARFTRPSPAMVVALIALFAALGANTLAFALGRNSVGARELAPIKQRAGKIVDRDTTAHDGSFAAAFGHAVCKRGEQLVGGGLRQHSGSETFIVPHASTIEEGPVLSKREWTVKFNSDLGGAARQDFTVFAMCLAR